MQPKLKCHWGTPLVLAFLCIKGELLTLLMGIAALLLHECCHIVVARRLGFSVERITVLPFGATMELFAAGQSGLGLVYLSGPLANAIAAMSILACMQLFPAITPYLEPFLLANGLLMLWNLLPLYPLDGARLLETVLKRICSKRGTKGILLGFTIVADTLLIALCVVGITLGVPCFLPLLMCLYIGIMGVMQLLSTEEHAVSAALCRRSRLTRGEALRVKMMAARAELTVGEALKSMGGDSFTILRVLDEKNQILGEMDENQLLRAAGRCGLDVPLKEILLGIDLP